MTPEREGRLETMENYNTRSGVDIRVALSSGAKLARAHEGLGKTAAAGAEFTDAKDRAKRVARVILRVPYRLLLRLSRPLGVRLRAYFNAPLEAQLNRIEQKLDRQTVAQMRDQRSAAARLVATHAQLLQELSAIRDALQARTARESSGLNADPARKKA